MTLHGATVAALKLGAGSWALFIAPSTCVLDPTHLLACFACCYCLLTLFLMLCAHTCGRRFAVGLVHVSGVGASDSLLCSVHSAATADDDRCLHLFPGSWFVNCSCSCTCSTLCLSHRLRLGLFESARCILSQFLLLRLSIRSAFCRLSYVFVQSFNVVSSRSSSSCVCLSVKTKIATNINDFL